MCEKDQDEKDQAEEAAETLSEEELDAAAGGHAIYRPTLSGPQWY